MYALMGAGLAGKNELPVMTAIHLYRVYALPCVLYGLECLRLYKYHIKSLENFQRKILRSLLNIPERTAIPSIYILTGQVPMVFAVHQRALGFLHSLIKEEGPTRDIIQHQYVMKSRTSHSWVTYIKDILMTYQLPSLHNLLHSLPSKTKWKEMVRRAVHKRASDEITEEANQLSTLEHLNPTWSYNKGHLSVTAGVSHQRQVTRANIKIRLLTGTYTLQTAQFRYGKATSDTCLMCKDGPENTAHFILDCKYLQPCREGLFEQLADIVPYVYLNRNILLEDRDFMLQMTLDASHPKIQEMFNLTDDCKEELEILTRDRIFLLHKQRALFMNNR